MYTFFFNHPETGSEQTKSTVWVDKAEVIAETLEMVGIEYVWRFS